MWPPGLRLLFTLAMTMVATTVVEAGDPPQIYDRFTDAIRGGKPNLSARLRSEFVDEDFPGLDEAEAVTLRTRLGYTTGSWQGLWGKLQAENVAHLKSDFFDTTDFSEVSESSLVADPKATEIDEAHLAWTGTGVSLKAGRQAVVFDNQRWIGTVAWRQNQQTMDALRLDITAFSNLWLSYVLVDEVHRLFGHANDSPFQDYEMGTSHLVNVNYAFPVGSLSGYAYRLDFENRSATNGPPPPALFDERTLSTNTVGMRFSGATRIRGGFKLSYAAEFANQKDADDNPLSIDHDYSLLEVGGTFRTGPVPLTLKLGYEVLEGDGNTSLQTPLGTVHIFNGWTDRFIGANSANFAPGLEDLYLLVSTKVSGIKLVGAYHRFKPNTGPGDYGDEVNLLAVKKLGKQWTVGAKFAHFNADNSSPVAASLPPPIVTDTDKFWLWGEFNLN